MFGQWQMYNKNLIYRATVKHEKTPNFMLAQQVYHSKIATQNISTVLNMKNMATLQLYRSTRRS